ncbi:MAG: DDE-type integrase/transposase/recombinase [Acidimicrobiales bacterium]
MAVAIDRFGVSQRLACRALGVTRSMIRRPPATPSDEEVEIRAWLRDFAKRRPRWGWRRAHDELVKTTGRRINRKRVQRLWRDEGLRVPQRPRKKPLRGDGVLGSFCPLWPDVVWAMDFQFDQTADRRPIKLLNLIDEHTRECPEILVERSITADMVVAMLDRTVSAQGGPPMFIRMDNGPEFIANAVRDWCASTGAGAVFIDPPFFHQCPVLRSMFRRRHASEFDTPWRIKREYCSRLSNIGCRPGRPLELDFMAPAYSRRSHDPWNPPSTPGELR